MAKSFRSLAAAPRRVRAALTWLLLAAWAAAGEPVHLVVLHTNDVHGQVLPTRATWVQAERKPLAGGIERVAACVRRVRAEAAAEGAGVIVVDCGDWSQGTPEGSQDGGRAFVRLLSAVGYDAMCVGNHELDRGVPAFEALLAEIQPPAICANVYRDGRRVAWGAPYRVVERAGVRVALVGLLATETPTITHQDARALEFVEPAVELSRLAGELKQQADLVLPVTHIGIEADRELARAHPELAVIVGGHSHTFLPEGERVGNVLVCQAGSKARGVGRVDLWIDRDSGEVVRTRASVIELTEEPDARWVPPELHAAAEALVERTKEKMAVVVGEAKGPLVRDRRRTATGSLGNWITDVLREELDADIAIQNDGGIRRDLDPGPITRRDLFEVVPFGNHAVLLELTGAQVRALLARSIADSEHTGLALSGCVVEWTPADPPRLSRVLVGGQPLDPSRTYRVATNDFLANGAGGCELLREAKSRRDRPELIRELLEKHLARDGAVVPDPENRYRAVAQ